MKRILAIALLFSAPSLPSYAAGTSYKLLDICKFDYEQYCKSIDKKRKFEIRACLAKQEKNLLPRCQDHYKEGR